MGAIFNGFPRGTIPLERNHLERIALKGNPLGLKALWGELWDECPWDEYAVNKCP